MEKKEGAEKDESEEDVFTNTVPKDFPEVRSPRERSVVNGLLPASLRSPLPPAFFLGIPSVQSTGLNRGFYWRRGSWTDVPVLHLSSWQRRAHALCTSTTTWRLRSYTEMQQSS